MENERSKLTEKDMHIIDVYSKKNLTGTNAPIKEFGKKKAGSGMNHTAIQLGSKEK